jgi:NADH dehydrogenase
MHIYLIEGGKRLLGNMSEKSSAKAFKYLEELGVTILLSKTVKDFNGNLVYLNYDSTLKSHTMIWAAGIKGQSIEGLGENVLARGNRLMVDRFNCVNGHSNIFAIGDLACMTEEKYPNGHPQVAQVAIQQAKCLAHNIKRSGKNKEMNPFTYRDLGTLATVGRNRAVVDLSYLRFQGLLAWFFWMFVHLMAIVGVKNRLLIFINWAYYYFTYDQSLRLIIKPKMKEGMV